MTVPFMVTAMNGGSANRTNTARTSAQDTPVLNPKVLNQVGLKVQPSIKDLLIMFKYTPTEIGFQTSTTLEVPMIIASAVHTVDPQT